MINFYLRRREEGRKNHIRECQIVLLDTLINSISRNLPGKDVHLPDPDSHFGPTNIRKIKLLKYAHVYIAKSRWKTNGVLYRLSTM